VRPITLSAIKQGMQRLREKGSPDPASLYDLQDGYVAIDGSVKQRPGTELAFTLPAGTLGMCAHDGDLVVFSTAPKACPAGVRCEVLTHPFFPSQGLTYIWFAAPFLGYLYVVGEFENGDVYHYWLQAANSWEASTMYREGQIIVPSTPNGLGYKAHRVLPKYQTWVPGMEVVLGTKIEPTTPNGYYYEATETSEAAGVGTPGGSPNPADPGTTPDGGPGTGTTPMAAGGGTASTDPGPDGGFADDTPYWIPEPAVFDVDIIGTDGAFDDTQALTSWRDRLGAPLGADWVVTDGKAQFTGRVGDAYGYRWRMSLPSQSFPRYAVTVTAKQQSSLGQLASLGIAWGVNTNPGVGAEAPNYIEASTPDSYAEETTVTHTWTRIIQSASMSPYGFYTHVNFMPFVRFSDPYDRISVGQIDDVTMTIAEVPVDMTPVTLDHIDFDAGLTGWYVRPDPSMADPDWPDLSTSAGAIIMESHHATKTFRDLYCEDPITLADAAGKYVKIVADVWCDDPSVDARGITTGGAHMFLASKTTSNGYALNGLYVAQRGDWTRRTWWWRVQGAPGGDLEGWHLCTQMRAASGYTVKVKIISVEVTDEVQD